MKVLAFAGTNSKKSINKEFVSYAAERLRAELMQNIEIQVVDINDYPLPIYSIDTENESGVPEMAKRFYQMIGEVDALLISYAEHNAHYPAVFKNLFDWMSRIDRKVYQDKPSVFFSVSPGPGGATRVLAAAEGSASHFGANLVASLSVPSFRENFDQETQVLMNTELDKKAYSALEKLRDTLEA